MNTAAAVVWTIIIFGMLMTIAFFAGQEVVPDIRLHESKPYCETKTVAGRNFKRCLRAVEVLPPEYGEILE